MINWVRPLRPPSARVQAIINTLGCLVLLIVLVTNVGEFRTTRRMLLTLVPSYFVVVWVAFVLAELVWLGIELNRLARDSAGPA